MKILDQRRIHIGTAGTKTGNACFGGIAQMPDGTLLVTWRVGSSKTSLDGQTLIAESRDDGKTWSAPRPLLTPPVLDGKPGEIKYTPLTVLGPDHLLLNSTWLDASDPKRPFVDPVTQHHVPTRVFLAESRDRGRTWGDWREFEPSPYDKLPLVCGPMKVMHDGRWSCWFEVDHGEEWHHAVVKFSKDRGKTWGPAIDVAHDPANRYLHWDQRIAVGKAGHVVAMFWTHDTQAKADVNIRIAESRDGGLTWSKPRDTGLSGQVAHPVILRDGRLVTIYVDRYKTRTLRAAISNDEGKTFEPNTLMIYDHGKVGDVKTEQGVMDSCFYTFGRPDALQSPDGTVHLVYYAGDDKVTGMHWARIEI